MVRQLSKTMYFVIVLLIVAGFAVYYSRTKRFNQATPPPQIMSNDIIGTLTLTSPAFQHNGEIPSRYTCQGDDVNPQLVIQGVPEGTRSLVLVLDDPDAPSGVWDHWVLWNIAPETKDIAENSTPPGAVAGTNSSGQARYQGPCPPSGTHRDRFTVYAVADVLSLAPGSGKQTVLQVITDKVLEQFTLVGLYQKS